MSCMKKITLFLLILLIRFTTYAADTLHLSSPDKQIHIKAWYNSGMYYQVFYNDNCIVMPSLVDMQLANGKALRIENAVASSNVKSVNSQIISPVPEKEKERTTGILPECLIGCKRFEYSTRFLR